MNKFFQNSFKHNQHLFDNSNKIFLCNNSDLGDCAICLTQFNIKDVVKQLGCKHSFHLDCINKWLSKNTHSCPCCRYECFPF